jgi:hypothetical protein
MSECDRHVSVARRYAVENLEAILTRRFRPVKGVVIGRRGTEENALKLREVVRILKG